MYGNSVSLTESPLQENLLYVGTDDGLIHVTDNAGQTWRKMEFFPGVPDLTYVSCLTASRHATNRVYAAFDNHKNGDFRPYLLVSDNRGDTWSPVHGNLPDRETAYSLQEDHENPDLLFAGTEFGAWFTLDRGQHWTRIGGLPTIAVRDIEIQRRENDLVLGTFGRGFYVLDDYSPLRLPTAQWHTNEAFLFPVKPALRYIPSNRLGDRSGRGSQGATLFTAPNPPFGAVFTYYLKEKIQSRRETRKEEEKDAFRTRKDSALPTIDQLRAEDRETEPELWLTVRDAAGNVVRRVEGPRDRGIHRLAWDLRYPPANPVNLDATRDQAPWEDAPLGQLALPGDYSASLSSLVDGTTTTLGAPIPFQIHPLELATFAATDKQAVLEFQNQVAALQRAVEGTLKSAAETESRLNHLQQAIALTPRLEADPLQTVHSLQQRLATLLTQLRGDPTLSSRDEPQLPSIQDRVNSIVDSQWKVTSPPTQTERDELRYARQIFTTVLADYRSLVEIDLHAVEALLETAGAPWTPGRIPVYP